MNKFITQKIGALAGFSDEILKILASFDADVSDVRLALQISKNAPLADKILDLAFCALSKFNPSQAASDTPPQNQHVAARADCALGSSISVQAERAHGREPIQEQGRAQQQKQEQEWGAAQQQGREQPAKQEQGAAALKTLNLQRAFELYGREQMRAFFLFAVFDEMLKPDLQAYRIDREKLTQVSLLRNLLMFSWIKSYPQIEQSILSSVILVEFGRVFIDEQVCAAGKAEEFYHAIKGSIFPQDFTDVEMKFTGTNRESVSHALFAHFGLEQIAQDALYSNAPDDAPFENKSRYAMLKIAKTAVNIYHHFDELSIDNALNLLVEFGFEQEAFLEAKGEISI